MSTIIAVCFFICIVGLIIGYNVSKDVNEKEMMFHDEDIWDDDDN